MYLFYILKLVGTLQYRLFSLHFKINFESHFTFNYFSIREGRHMAGGGAVFLGVAF